MNKIRIFYYRAIRGCVTIVSNALNKFALRFIHCAQYGASFGTCGLLNVRNYSNQDGIVIGDDVFINSCRIANPIGGDTKTSFFVGEGAKLRIGDGVKMSNVTLFTTKSITIGSQTLLGGGTRIYDTDFHSIYAENRLNGNTNIASADVVIGRKCFIGSNVLILKGVTIGDEVVVGANSVITHDIPSREIWAGNPAKMIKKMINE